MCESSPVVTELGQSPGAEDTTESRQTEVDLGVRVRLKTRGQLLLEGGDLLVELFDDGHAGGDAVDIRLGDQTRRLQLGQAHPGLDLTCLRLQGCDAPTPPQPGGG